MKYIMQYKNILEYQKILNLLDNTSTQLNKLKTKNLVKISDHAGGTANTNN